MTSQCILSGSEGYHTSDNGTVSFTVCIGRSRDQKALFGHEAGDSPGLVVARGGGSAALVGWDHEDAGHGLAMVA